MEESLIEPEPDGQGVQSLPIELLFPNPGNPRKKFDEEELEKLTESIRQIGILSPLIVMKAGKGYRIVAGERRWRAALAAGLDEVPVIVRELTLEQEFEIMMVENLQREDLDPIEEAQAYQAAIDLGWKQTELAEKLGISQAQIANRLRLLKLPAQTKESISHKILSAGHGLALVKVAQAPELVEKIAALFERLGTPVAKTGEVVNDQIARYGNPLYKDAWGAPSFNYQEICRKCKMKVHGGHNFEKEEHPYCLNAECWERHERETKDAIIEKQVKEVLGEDVEASELPHISDLDVESYEIFNCRVKKEECFDCEYMCDALNWNGELTKICRSPECFDAKATKKWEKEQEKLRAKNDALAQEKLQIVESFTSRSDNKNTSIYMVLRLVEMIKMETCTNPVEKVVEYLGFNMPVNLSWDEEIELLFGHLQGIASAREIIGIVLMLLLENAQPRDMSWKLTLGAQPEQESEAS